MSNNILKSIGVITLGLTIGYSLGLFIKPQESNRLIASYPISKLSKVQNTEPLFDIKMNTEELSLTEDGISNIKITVTALKEIPTGFLYTWKLQQDTQLVEGLLSDGLGELSVNQSKEFNLKVRGFSKQARKFINFEINGEYLQKSVHREVLISSRIEDSHEFAIQQNELKKNKNSINKLNKAKTDNKFDPEHIVQ